MFYKRFLPLAALLCAAIFTTLFFDACKPTVKIDPVAEIVKDLDSTTYLLNFSSIPEGSLIQRTSYGDLSDLTPIPNPDLTPNLLRYGYVFVPKWKIHIPPKTCTDWVPSVVLYERFTELSKLLKVNILDGIEAVKTTNGGVLLATKDALQPLKNIQADMMDSVAMKGVNVNKVLLLPTADDKVFKRDYYGQGILPQAAGVAERGLRFRTKQDLIRRWFPNQIGCFDPIDLGRLRENLIKIDRLRFGNLQISQVETGISTLSAR